MVRIIVISGRGSQPSRSCKQRYVREVLIESVRRVNPQAAARLAAFPRAIQHAYYADLIRPRTGDAVEPCAGFRRAIDRLYLESRRCPTWLTFRAYLHDLGIDVSVELERMLKYSLRDRVLSRRFPDVLLYFRDHALASRIRARLQQLLLPALRGNTPVVLLAHSLGSVIAYDVLWKLSHTSGYAALRRRKVELLVTLGSPLGDRVVKSHLLGWRGPPPRSYPANIARWVNIAARGDAISHDERLANDFEGMIRSKAVGRFEDRVRVCTMYRGRGRVWNPHALYGYLLLEDVGRLVSEVVL